MERRIVQGVNCKLDPEEYTLGKFRKGIDDRGRRNTISGQLLRACKRRSFGARSTLHTPFRELFDVSLCMFLKDKPMSALKLLDESIPGPAGETNLNLGLSVTLTIINQTAEPVRDALWYAVVLIESVKKEDKLQIIQFLRFHTLKCSVQDGRFP